MTKRMFTKSCPKSWRYGPQTRTIGPDHGDQTPIYRYGPTHTTTTQYDKLYRLSAASYCRYRYITPSLPPSLSLSLYCHFHLICPAKKKWRETLFVCLVQIESKANRLISICTKHRKSVSHRFFSRGTNCTQIKWNRQYQKLRILPFQK